MPNTMERVKPEKILWKELNLKNTVERVKPEKSHACNEVTEL